MKIKSLKLPFSGKFSAFSLIASCCWLPIPLLFGEPGSLQGLRENSFRELEKKTWLAEPQSFPEIENEIVRAIQMKPSSAEYHYLIAHLYVRKYSNSPADMSLLKKASEMAQQAIDLAPVKEFGYIVIAEVLDIMGQTPNALRMIDPAFNPKIQPSWRSRFIEAKLRSDRLKNIDILKLLDSAMSMPEAQIEIMSPYVIAILASEKGHSEMEEALAHWDSRFPNFLFKESRALALARLNRFHEAHSLYVQSYSPGFTRAEAMLNDAIILQTNLRQPKKSEILLRHIIERLAKKSSTNVITAAHANLGVVYLQSNRIPQAEQEFVEAIKNSSNRFETLEFITKAFRKQRKYRQLAKLIRRLNQETPGSGVLYALLGETLSEDLNDHDIALEAFADAIILEPKRSDFYNGMGLAYYRKKSLPQALLLFQQASKIDPDDAIARYNTACVLARLGRKNEAVNALKEAVGLDPRLVDSARKDPDFKSLETNTHFVETVSRTGNDTDLSH